MGGVLHTEIIPFDDARKALANGAAPSVQLLADGETTASAARKLEISNSTVRTHVEHMRLKLGAKTRAALVSLGHRFGFLT